MSDAAISRATYEELLALPKHVIGEILGGELVVSPRPASPHTRVTSVLGRSIGGPFDYDVDGPGGWLILDEPELHLGPDVVVPDLAGWRRERVPTMPDTPAFTLAPDWVCEVLSPSTASRDRTVKMDIFGREEVGHLWFIDPRLQLLEVFRWSQAWVRVGSWRDEVMVRAEPFEAVEFSLARLWSR